MLQLIIINKALLSQQMEGDQAIDITMYMICMPNNDYEHSVRKKERKLLDISLRGRSTTLTF